MPIHKEFDMASYTPRQRKGGGSGNGGVCEVEGGVSPEDDRFEGACVSVWPTPL